MVRSRLYVPGDTSISWRSRSVPPDDLRPNLDVNVLHKAHMIKTHAVNDADAIKAASKRHDIDFLNDISNKLAVATQPRVFYRESTPAYPRYSYSPSPSVTVVAPPQPDYRRRTLYAQPVTDYEITNYLAGGPLPYRRAYRGASMPPASPVSVSHWTPSPVPAYRASSVSRAPAYSSVVVGVPYKKYPETTTNHVTNNHSLYVPRRHSYAPANGLGSVSNYRTSLPRVPAYKSLYDDVDEILSTPRHRGASVKRYNDSDLEVEWPTMKPLTSLKGRAQSVQRQLDGIPEFQVYTPSRARAASTVPTFSSVPAPSPVFPRIVSSGSSLPPPAAAPTNAPRKPNRPPVSEARRKVRDLLCKSKNDPHYFAD